MIKNPPAFKGRIARRGGMLMASGLAAMLCAGCESIVPRSELRAVASLLPPASAVEPPEIQRLQEHIALQSGVSGFAFTQSEFEPETRLPSGTQWILGVFIGE